MISCNGVGTSPSPTAVIASTNAPTINSLPSSKAQPQSQTPEVAATRTRHPSLTPTITRTRPPSKTPTQTWTRRPTNTRTIKPTSTSTSSIADVFLPTPPVRDISAYRLRRWSESDSAALVDRLNNGKFKVTPEPDYYQFPDYVRAFDLEYLLRFPQSPSWEDVAWEAVRYDPQGAMAVGSRAGEDLFGFLVENILNKQYVSIDDLSSRLELHLFRIADSLKVNNLFADGQDAWVIHVQTSYYQNYDGFYAIYQVSGAYRLELIQGWGISSVPGAGSYYYLHDVGDTNNNNIREVGIVGESGISGIPQTWGQSLMLYEWQPSKGGFTSNYFPLFYQTCGEMGQGPCKGDWEFGAQQLTVREYWYTQDKCPDLEIQHQYAWDGSQYHLNSEQVILPEINRPGCLVAWADGAINHQVLGWQDDRAIQIITTALDNWPTEMDNQWGPASRDYFRLRLGIWNDLRGASDKAVSLLNQLAAGSTDPKYDLPTRLAGIYLQTRAQKGLVGACTQVEQAWRDEKDAFYNQFVGSYDLENLRQSWGFASDRWIYRAGISIGSLCDREDAIISSAKTLKISSAKDLENWLDQVGIHWFDVQPADPNVNGSGDWLALLEYHSQRSDEVETWAFIRKPAGFDAILVNSFVPGLTTLKLELRSFKPNNDKLLVQVVRVQYNLYAFYISPEGVKKELIDLGFVTDFHNNNNSQGCTIIVTTSSPSVGEKTTEYIWDSSLMDFVEQDEFKIHEQEAERLVYHELDFPAAITYIEKFLAEATPEPRVLTTCYESGCEYAPDWYLPHLRYLLGIAYELNLQPDQAIKVYYHLWQVYPNNIFGLAAAAKLVPLQP